MLNHPTYDKLRTMKLLGMAQALQEQTSQAIYHSLSFEERLGLLVDRESADRDNRQLAVRLAKAKLRQNAAFEDIDFRKPRGLDRSIVLALGGGDWIRRHNNCLVTGPTGVGKSFLACAVANKICRDGASVAYARAPRLLAELAIARADGSHGRRLLALARVELLVLDDWGLAPLTGEHSRDFLEILDDRYDRRSTMIVSQTPVDLWHALMPDPAIADAALDRLVHNAHRLTLSGPSMRQQRGMDQAAPSQEAADASRDASAAPVNCSNQTEG
jgi:DNA replication protein DnaC